jgi:plasmid stabilization system protein ParE
MQQVVLQSKAKNDMVTIVQRTRTEWGYAQATEVENLLVKAFGFISLYPYLGRSTRDSAIFTKTLPKLPFVIIYELSGECIYIIQILHTKQKR